MSHCFVFQIDDPVVRLDIAETLESSFPDLVVHHADGTNDLIEKIASLDHISGVFTSQSALRGRAEEIMNYTQAKDIPHIHIGTPPPAAKVSYLDMPFSTSSVVNVLRGRGLIP